MASDTSVIKLASDNAADTPDPDSFFNIGGGLRTAMLGKFIKRRGPVYLGFDGRLYRYKNGVYQPDGEAFVCVEARLILDYRCKGFHFADVLKWIKADHPKITDQPVTNVINCRNGLLEHQTLRLLQHSTVMYSTIQLPVNYNPEATCQLFEAFLEQVLPDNAIDFLYEIIGTAIYLGNPFRSAVLLLGPGKNGKSVLLNVIQSLLGQDNVSSVPLQTLTENRFAAAELFGKLANICGDLDSRAVKSTGAFKMITGGDLVHAERKYGHPFKFTSFALPMFSANEAPMSSDQTEAWFDRWLIIPMERRIKDEDVDPHLTQKLTTPSELEGILVKAVAGLRRVLDRGGYEIPASVKAACKQFRDQVDTTSSFFAECCVIKPDKWTLRSTLYKTYREFCSDSGRPAVTAQAFNGQIRERYKGRIIEGTRHGGKRGWNGISL